jgi:dihydroneopterin triphosphate diphosphatase
VAGPKIPESVLVVIHTPELDVLLLERAQQPGFWQSVTGSKDALDEPLERTARREVFEETGIDTNRPECRLTDWQLVNRYEIFPQWRYRYAAGVTQNTEHVFGLQIPERCAVRLALGEHRDSVWLPWSDAAERCFSWSNVEAIRQLPGRIPR